MATRKQPRRKNAEFKRQARKIAKERNLPKAMIQGIAQQLKRGVEVVNG